MRSVFRSTVVLALGLAPLAAAAQDIDTRNVDTYVYGGGGIYGQTFTVGSSPLLLSYSFWVGANQDVGPYDFYSQLFAWAGGSISGPALYTSATYASGCCDDLVPPRYDFDVGGLSLVSGAQYIAIVARTTAGGLKLGYVYGPNGFIDSYSGGEFYGGVGASSVPDPANSTYFPIQFVAGNDLMFVADFQDNVVPEPSTLALVGGGLLVAAVTRRRRREPR